MSETLKYLTVLTSVIADAGLSLDDASTRHTILVIVYDLLLGRRHLQATSPLERQVIGCRAALSKALSQMRAERNVKSNAELLPESVRNAPILPRWVRVNTLKARTDEAIAAFVAGGFKLLDYDDAMARIELPGRGKWIARDRHIPDLLVPASILLSF